MKEGRKEGRQEGGKEGRKAGREERGKEGIKEGRKDGRKEGRKECWEEIKNVASTAFFFSRAIQSRGISTASSCLRNSRTRNASTLVMAS